MKIKSLLVAMAISITSLANAANIKSDAPQAYTVQKGDTLWKISGMYLDAPWKWQELWGGNPSIKNPNLIYPGDEIYIVDGKISIRRKGQSANSGHLRSVKLSPEKREVPLDMGIPVINYEKIKSTLVEAKIMNAKEITKLPYIVSVENQRLSGNINQRVYIQGALTPGQRYDVYKQGETHKSKRGSNKKNIELGTELIKTGEVIIERVDGEMSTAVIKAIKDRRLSEGQRLILQDKAAPNFYFEPKIAPFGTEARIVSIPGLLHNVGRGFTVIIDRGLDAGLDKGDVLLVETEKRYTEDPYTKKKIALPAEAIGTIMVYDVYDQMSLAVVMDSKDRMKSGEYAVTPHSAVND